MSIVPSRQAAAQPGQQSATPPDLRLHRPAATPALPPAATTPHIRPREMAQLLNISIRTLMRWRQQGRLPRPLPGYGQLHWRRSEIVRWIACGIPRLELWDSINQRKG